MRPPAFFIAALAHRPKRTDSVPLTFLPPAAAAETERAYSARWAATVSDFFASVTAWADANGWDWELIDLGDEDDRPPAGHQVHLMAPADRPKPEHGVRERLVFAAGSPDPADRGRTVGIGVDWIPDLVGGSLTEVGGGWLWRHQDDRFGPGSLWRVEDIPELFDRLSAEAAAEDAADEGWGMR